MLAKPLADVADLVDEGNLAAAMASGGMPAQEHGRLRKLAAITRVACLIALLLAACGYSGPDQLRLAPVAFRDLPGWQADRVAEAMPALSSVRAGRGRQDARLARPAAPVTHARTR